MAAYYLNLVYQTLFVIPLRYLYLNGPSFFGFGFWNGANTDHICSEMTKVNDGFWTLHPNECNDLINQRVQSFMIMIAILFYFLFWFRNIYRALVRLFLF